MKSSIFPAYYRIILNPTSERFYIHSLFVGLTAPILNLPVMFWHFVIDPMLAGFVRIFMFIGICWYGAFTGRLLGASDEDVNTHEPS